jgi:hypothetical protein
MSREKEDQAKKLSEEEKARNEKVIGSVDHYIREFNKMLLACEKRARKKPPDKSTVAAENDAHTLRGFLHDLQSAQEKGHGGLPILRTREEWDALHGMQQRCAKYEFDKTPPLEQSHQSTPGFSQPTSTEPTSTEDKQDSYYEENLRRLNILDRYNENPRSENEEELVRDNLINRALNQDNTFISYKDLEKMAKNGEEFFLPPNSKEDACLSCGNGRFYKGSLSEIHTQLEGDLKNDPGNDQLKSGLKRIQNEMIAKPNLALPKMENIPSEEKKTQQENTSTAPNPFSTKPKPM